MTAAIQSLEGPQGQRLDDWYAVHEDEAEYDPDRPGKYMVMGPEPYFATCKLCGGHVDKPQMPARIEALFAYMHYAEELHRECLREFQVRREVLL